MGWKHLTKGFVGDLDSCLGITNMKGENTKKNKTSCDFTALSSTLNNRPELSRSCSKNGCPLLRVCVFTTVSVLGWVKCRAQTQSMGRHTWPHITSLFHLPT